MAGRDPLTPPRSRSLPHDSRHEAELGVRREGLALPQCARRQQPLLPAGVVLGAVPALVLREGSQVGSVGWFPGGVPSPQAHAPSPLTSQASRMVTTSPLRKASSPGLGRVCSHLVMHWVPGAQRL